MYVNANFSGRICQRLCKHRGYRFEHADPNPKTDEKDEALGGRRDAVKTQAGEGGIQEFSFVGPSKDGNSYTVSLHTISTT
jgi:hypothetical protein